LDPVQRAPIFEPVPRISGFSNRLARQHFLKLSLASADNELMGELIEFPNCKEISPEASRRILERTRKASYWVRRWSEIHKTLCEQNPNDADPVLFEDSSLYLDGWLYDRNPTATKARWF